MISCLLYLARSQHEYAHCYPPDIPPRALAPTLPPAVVYLATLKTDRAGEEAICLNVT